jgi:hypothetical protein
VSRESSQDDTMVKEKLLQKIIQLDNCLFSCMADYLAVNLLALFRLGEISFVTELN